MVKALIFLAVLCLLVRQHSCGSTTILNVYITWNNRGSQTDFTVTSALGNGITSSTAWLGVGLTNTPSKAMQGTDVIVCINNGGTFSIQHNYNNYYTSSLMSSGTPQLGITNATIKVVGSNLTCSYTRDNSNSNSYYFNINSNQYPYMISAYGTLSSGSMQQHLSSNRGASSSKLDFSNKSSKASLLTSNYSSITLVVLALALQNILKFV